MADTAKGKKSSAKGKTAKRSKINPKRLKPRFPKYFKESYQELKKVTWPTRKEAWKLTLAVFIFSAVFSIIIVVADSIIKIITEELFL